MKFSKIFRSFSEKTSMITKKPSLLLNAHPNQSAAMGGKSSSSGRPSIFACDLKTWWLYTYYFYIPTPLFRRFPYPFSSTPPRIENKAGRTFCCICATCHMYFDQHFRGSDMLTKKSEWTQWRMVMCLYGGTMQQFAEQAYPYSLYDKKRLGQGCRECRRLKDCIRGS